MCLVTYNVNWPLENAQKLKVIPFMDVKLKKYSSKIYWEKFCQTL